MAGLFYGVTVSEYPGSALNKLASLFGSDSDDDDDNVLRPWTPKLLLCLKCLLGEKNNAKVATTDEDKEDCPPPRPSFRSTQRARLIVMSEDEDSEDEDPVEIFKDSPPPV